MASPASVASGQSYPKSVQGFGPLTQVLPEAQRSKNLSRLRGPDPKIGPSGSKESRGGEVTLEVMEPGPDWGA